MISENNPFRKLKDYLKKEAKSAQQGRVKASINAEVQGTVYDSWKEGLEEGKFLMADKLLSFVESMEREAESREYAEKLSSMKQSSSGDNEWIPTNVNLPKETKIGVWLTLQKEWGRQVVHGQWCWGHFKHVNGKEIDIDTVVAWKPLEYPEPYMEPTITMDTGYGTIDYYPVKEQEHLNLPTPPVTIEQTVYRINEGAKEPIIPMTVIEVSQRVILKGEPFWQIKAMDIESGNTITYPEFQFNHDVFFTKERAEEELRTRLTERPEVSEER